MSSLVSRPTAVFSETRAAVSAALAYWLCQLLGWGLNGFGQAYSAVVTLHQPAVRIVLEVALLNAIGLGFSHLLRGFIKRHGWATLAMSSLLPRMIAASVLLALPIAVIMRFTSVARMWMPHTAEDIAALERVTNGLSEGLWLPTANWSALFVLWTVLYLCITSLRDRRSAQLRQSELIRALQLAELRVLESQLNPHFLFNSLNSVRALIADDPAGAQDAVTRLARILRYTLGSGQEELVTLERELEFVEDYLGLESLRYGERLLVERDIATSAKAARIPVMLLQILVENAIKHGIAELQQGGVLRIHACLRAGVLMIEVENSRPTAPPRHAPEGVGLHNATERLRLLFGPAASLELDLSSPDVARARVRVPHPS